MPYEEPSAEQQRAAWFTGGSSKVNGQYPVWKAAALRPVDGKTLVEQGKSKSTQWAEVHAVFRAVIEELNNDKSPYVWIFTDPWAVANGLAGWSGKWAVENWTAKGMPMWGAALWKSLWEFKGHIKVGHVDALQKNTLPGSEGD